MTETDDPSAPSPRVGLYPAVWALLFIVIVGGGSYAIRVFYTGATLVVEADAAATAVLKTSAVTLREIDGPLFYTLRAGVQHVRPGRYRIDVDWEQTELTFSTGQEFSAQRGEQVEIRVTGESRAP